jgi:alanyl-tRNA synthetase
MMKITKWERIRSNLRFEFLCGTRAFEDYALKNRIVRHLGSRLSVHEKDVIESVENLMAEGKARKKAAKNLEEQISRYEAREIVQKAEGRIVKGIRPEKTPDGLRFLALSIVDQGDFVALFGTRSESRSHIVMACAGGVRLDLREVVPDVSPLINGKGGGGPTLVELAGDRDADLEAALEKACRSITLKMK